ncbi:hypothetical protein J6590_013558 [Homalodisca vitripennis]|nr:hypothetical protein J6590_013558 [Homalodisca vitripennis]
MSISLYQQYHKKLSGSETVAVGLTTDTLPAWHTTDISLSAIHKKLRVVVRRISPVNSMSISLYQQYHKKLRVAVRRISPVNSMSISLYKQYHKKLRVAVRRISPVNSMSISLYQQYHKKLRVAVRRISPVNSMSISLYQQYHKKLRVVVRRISPVNSMSISLYQQYHKKLRGSETVADGRAGLLTHYRLGTPHREYLLRRSGWTTDTLPAWHTTPRISPVNSMSISLYQQYHKKLRVAVRRISPVNSMSISLYQQYHKKLRVAVRRISPVNSMSISLYQQYHKKLRVANISCQQYEHITLSAIPQETESGSETVADGRAGLLTHYRLGTPHREYLLRRSGWTTDTLAAWHTTPRIYLVNTIPQETESGSETVVDGRAGLLTHYRLGTPHREYLLSNSMSISLYQQYHKTESGSKTVVDGRAGLLTHYRLGTPHREYLLSYEHITYQQYHKKLRGRDGSRRSG